MSDVPNLDDLVAGFRRLLAAEYQRGQDDATKRIIAAATGGQKPAATNGQYSPTEPADSAVETKRQRVPHGAPDALITRVLTASGPAGATPQDIQQAQSSDDGPGVSYSGIRFALDRGKKKNRYRNQGGRWFLMERR
jgi:hypothetical protein